MDLLHLKRAVLCDDISSASWAIQKQSVEEFCNSLASRGIENLKIHFRYPLYQEQVSIPGRRLLFRLPFRTISWLFSPVLAL